MGHFFISILVNKEESNILKREGKLYFNEWTHTK